VSAQLLVQCVVLSSKKSTTLKNTGASGERSKCNQHYKIAPPLSLILSETYSWVLIGGMLTGSVISMWVTDGNFILYVGIYAFECYVSCISFSAICVVVVGTVHDGFMVCRVTEDYRDQLYVQTKSISVEGQSLISHRKTCSILGGKRLSNFLATVFWSFSYMFCFFSLFQSPASPLPTSPMATSYVPSATPPPTSLPVPVTVPASQSIP
jgi:hypothetical protein